MRKRFASVFAVTVFAVGVLAGPAEASGGCQKATSALDSKSVVASVTLNGAIWNGNHGLQVRMNTYQAYLRRPTPLQSSRSLHVMYAIDEPFGSGDAQEYIEFGWERTRNYASYGPITAIVVHTVPGREQGDITGSCGCTA
jgi:hypothetical protein